MTSDLVKLGLQIAANNQGLIEWIVDLESENEKLRAQIDELEKANNRKEA